MHTTSRAPAIADHPWTVHMKCTRPDRELGRGNDTRSPNDQNARARGGDDAQLKAAETAWPAAMENLAQAIGNANQDLADRGLEARFINNPLTGNSTSKATEIVLRENGEPATASVALNGNGNIDIIFKHSARQEHRRLRIVEASVDVWAGVLHQLYKIAIPPQTYI
jgi:hypothetical protein